MTKHAAGAPGTAAANLRAGAGGLTVASEASAGSMLAGMRCLGVALRCGCGVGCGLNLLALMAHRRFVDSCLTETCDLTKKTPAKIQLSIFLTIKMPLRLRDSEGY